MKNYGERIDKSKIDFGLYDVYCKEVAETKIVCFLPQKEHYNLLCELFNQIPHDPNDFDKMFEISKTEIYGLKLPCIGH